MKKLVLPLILVCFLSAKATHTVVPTPQKQTVITAIEEVREPDPMPRHDFYPLISAEHHRTYVPATYKDASIIQFSNGISFDTRDLGKAGEPYIPEDMRYQPGESEYYIVQFNGPIYDAQKEWLSSLNAQIHFYIPHYGFVCSIQEQSDVDAVRSHPSINWVGLYQPAYKVSHLFERVDEEHKVIILLFNDADLNTILGDVKAITRNNEFEANDNGINKMIQGKVNQSDLAAIARISGVYWIEPYLQNYQHNQQYQWVVQTGYHSSAPGGNDLTTRTTWAHGIMGEGEIVNTTDSGIHTAHDAFCSGSSAITTWGYYSSHNAIVAYDSGAPSNIQFGDGPGSSWHGTHTGGTIAGDDTLEGSSYYDGIAKRARNYFLDCGDNTSTGIYTYGDLNDGYIKPYNRHYPPIRAHISSGSWGSDAAGAYITSSYTSDQFMWAHKDFLLFYSNGNRGAYGAGQVGAPATAKNVVSVGGTSNSTSCRSLYTTTSQGPTQDGRQKPTVLTPGRTIISAQGGYTSQYWSMSGTSMASPGCAGCGCLIRQYLREGWYPTGKKTAADGFSFISASLIKAMLINSADNDITSYQPPSNRSGWGRVDLDSILFFSGDTRKLLVVDNTTGVLTGERVDYHFNVPSGATHLRITLVWTDYPGNPSVIRQIVNDLDLSAYVGGTHYHGNQYSSGQSVTNPTAWDSINVEECVRLNSPTSGSWRVTVDARNVPYGPQPYSLVIAYSAATVAGVVQLDKPCYWANDFNVDTVEVRVEDTNFGSASAIDQVMVVMTGVLTETQPETLWCTELAESAYVFIGHMPLLFHKPVHGDGKLAVCQGDSVFVSYTDANPSFVSTTWATIDAEYFVISDVHCENIEASMVDVCWTTTDNATSVVHYGTDPGNLNQTFAVDTPYVTPHRVRVMGLTPQMLYYYDVESKDYRGNSAYDDNGGNHYSFTTGSFAGVDILVALADGYDKGTNQGNALPGLQARFRKAIETGGWSYTWWATSDNSGDLPPTTAMRDFKAIFVPNEDEYPQFLPRHMDTIRIYEQNGGRIAFSSHDVMWYSWDPTGGNPQIAQDSMWCKNYLHARYRGDITALGNWNIFGVSGDPISNPYTGGVGYSPHRDGADGDSIVGVANPPNGWDTGTTANVWRWNSTTGPVVGVRWESNSNHGTPGQGVWGGYKTRTVMNAFSATQMDTMQLPGILNQIFIWLIGHDHPDVAISSPVGGNTYSTSPVNIVWTATAYGGAAIDTTWIQYSPDEGQTWFTLASGTGVTSPYSWDISSLTNGARYRVKVTVSDKNVYPSMKGYDITGNFTINIAGNDYLGPKVIPQSIVVQENPMVVTPTHVLLPIAAVVNDSVTGMSNIAAAEWSLGSNPATPGSGDAMNPGDGAYNQIQEGVVDTCFCNYNPGWTQVCTLWVRGRDAANNWGNGTMRTFTLIDGQIIIGIAEDGRLIPMHYSLSSPMPNPFSRAVGFQYGIPRQTKVSLKIYNALGQLVKTVCDGVEKPGVYHVTWDGHDDLNRMVSSGIYFYRLSTDDFISTQKMVIVR